MAIENAKTLNVRIRNKYDSYEKWIASNLVLEAGEIAIAYTTVDVKVDNGTAKHPALLMKVGDGEKTFANLPWLSAKAADVLDACKSTDALTTFVNNVIADAGIASNEAMEALSGRVSTAEGKITTLEGKMTDVEGKAAANEAAIAALELLVGDDNVNTQIKNYVDGLNLADTYAAKTHGHAIADVEGLSDSIAAAKKAGDDAAEALGEYKTLNDAAVKVNSDAIAAIKKDATITTFKGVEEALAGKQAAGDYAAAVHKHEIADVNGLSAAIEDAKKAGTDASGAAAQALTDAKAYTDSEMTRLVGDETVGTQITNAIDALNLDSTYDAFGAADQARQLAESYANDLVNSSVTPAIQVLERDSHTHSNKDELDKIVEGNVAKWNATEQGVKTYADNLNSAMNARVLALEGKFGDGEGNVDAQITAAVAAEAELREAADEALQGQIGTASAEGKPATGLHARIEELEGLVGDDKVSESIADAVQAEKERAEGIESGLAARIKAVEDDYLTSVEEKALQDQITANANAITLLTDGVNADEVDGVKDLIQYVKDHGTEVTGMKDDIEQNADDIDALEGRMDAAEAAIATKAAQSDLEGLAGRVTTVENDLNTETTGLKARMTAAETDIGALETKVGDKAVSEQITDVTNPLAERIVELEKVDHDHSNKTVLDGISAEKVAAWDKVSEKANDADLAAIAKTGSTDDLVQGTMTLVFDCGTSAV